MRLWILFAIFVTTVADYSDPEARYKIFPMASAVFNNNPQTCVSNTFQNGQVVRRLVINCDIAKSDTCAAFTAYSEPEKVIILSFRGTDGSTQFILEAEETILAQHTSWVGGGKVSKYFNDAFFRLWNGGIKSDLLTLINKYPDYKLIVTGHSLGGALAALAGSYIATLGLYPLDQIQLMTFGEPRVGDANFASSVDTMLPGTFRLVHYKDIVPHLPFRNLEGYVHHHAEVYYKEDMSPGAPYVVCMKDESLRCSDGNVVDLNNPDHLTYFNVNIGNFEEKGCNYTLASNS